MSKNKTEYTPGNAIAAATAPDAPPPKLPRSKKPIIIAFLILLVVAAVVGAGYALLHKSNNSYDKSANQSTDSQPKQEEPEVTPYSEAWAAAIEGDGTKAQQILDGQLRVAKTPEEKMAVYYQKMSAALNSEEYDQLLTIGEQAEGILQTDVTAKYMYNAYLAKGDKQEAKRWLQRAIDRLDKDNNSYERNLDELEDKMQDLD